MIQLNNGKDIPDPEFYGAEMVVVDTAEKAAHIKRMDEQVKCRMNPKFPHVIYRDRVNWIRIFVTFRFYRLSQVSNQHFLPGR
jgi:hypothetical protein